MQIKEVTLTKVFSKVETTQYGDKLKVAIKTVEYGDGKWLSTFKTTPEMKEWKEGDKVTIEVIEKGAFLNFTVPSGAGADVEKRLTKLEKAVFGDSTSTEKSIDIDEGTTVVGKGVDDFDF